MNRFFLKLAAFAMLVFAIAACTPPNDPPPAGDVGENSARPVSDIGPPLFEPAAWPETVDDPSSGADPIRVPFCHLTVLDRVDVPSKEDGTVDWLGVELKPDEVVDPKDRFVHPRTKKQYVRLRPGDRVKRGQIIALLNDERADLETQIAASNIEGAKDEQRAAAQAIIYYVENVKIEKDAQSSKAHLVAAQANLAKAESEKSSKEWTVKRTEGELKKAEEKRDNHFIRAPFDGEIVQFFKRVGEGVKAGEALLQIQNTGRLGLEGNLEVQYVGKVAVGTEVYLEPSIMEPPLPLRSPHASSKPITAVAAGIRGKKQVVISASEDGSVHVWDSTKVHASWPHAGAVRALAVTRPGLSRQLILTGCDDGKARLWSLDEFGRDPVAILDGHHEGGVHAAAFSPDGNFCVTADDRGDIFLFDTVTGKKRYTFPREHNGTVTTLQFTPQGRVVSMGRDHVALIWNVGDKGAAVETTLDHRAGEVANLGVSDDGGQMLLDLDKSRLRVVDVASQRNRGTLYQAGDAKFNTVALLSPMVGVNGDRVILTTGVADGVLQIWRWTNGPGRGSELKKLICTGYVPVTCAAFSPVARNGFIVAGTRKGDVHVWSMPVPEEMNNRFKARITNVSPNLESSGKSVRIHAEYDNADARLSLRPGTTATMVIPQK